ARVAAARIGNVAVRPGGQAAIVIAEGAEAGVLDARERELAVVRDVVQRRLVAGTVAEQKSLRERHRRGKDHQSGQTENRNPAFLQSCDPAIHFAFASLSRTARAFSARSVSSFS